MAPLSLQDVIGALAYAYWPVWLAFAVGSTAVYFVKGRPRFLSIITAPFAIVAAIELGFIALDAIGRGIDIARTAAHTSKLAGPLRVGNAIVPAGLVVADRNEDGDYVVHAGRGPVTVSGLALTGDFEIDVAGLKGNLTLARDQNVMGIPCSSGSGVYLSDDYLECVLSKTYREGGMTFEAGTEIKHGGGDDYDFFIVGDKEPSVRIFKKGCRRVRWSACRRS